MNRKILSVFMAVLVFSSLLVGVVAVPVTAQDSGSSSDSETSTSTDSNTNNNFAELIVEQQSYVSGSVNETEENGQLVYEVEGDQVRLYPRNFEHKNVEEYGLRGSDGSIEFDQKSGSYILDFDGVDGSYNIYFDVTQEQEVQTTTTNEDGEEVTETSTEQVTVEYTATISAVNTSYKHITESSYEETQDKADRWESFTTELDDIGVDEENYDRAVTQAVGWLGLLYNPLQFLTGGFTGWIILTVTTPGGLLGATLTSLVVIFLVGGSIRYANMRAARDKAQQSLEEIRQNIINNNMKQAMANVPIHSIFKNDNTAEAVSEALDAENLYEAWEALKDRLGVKEVFQDRISVMLADGYNVVETDDGHTVKKDVDDTDKVVKKDEIDEDIIEEVAGDDTVSRYNLAESDAKPAELNLDIDEINDRLGIAADDSLRKEKHAEWLIELTAHIQKSDLTDLDGRVRPVRTVLERLLSVALEADKYEAPQSRYYTEMLMYAQNSRELSEESEQLVNRIQSGNLGDDE